MVNEKCTQNWLTVKSYEKLTETIGVDSTLIVFYRQLEKVRHK